jgi:hypothetical protein
MNLFANTIYINLEHRTDRNAEIIKELDELHIHNPVRMNGMLLKTGNGAIGCSMSHIKCLELAKKEKYPYVFICEDDFKCINKKMFLQQIKKFEENSVTDKIDWDVLLIGGNNCAKYHIPPKVDYCVMIENSQTTIGYVVKDYMYDIMITNFKEGITKLMTDPKNEREFACDIYWKKLQKEYRWYLIVPLTITQNASYSDVVKHNVNYDRLMLTLDKQNHLNKLQFI